MASKRTSSRGFTLIELLVVIATTTILIGLLLPAASDVRKAAAAQAALELVGDKSYVNAALCTPPFCKWLGPARDSSLRYPDIPAGIKSGPVLASGLRVSYAAAKLGTQPFELHPWDWKNISDPGVITVDISFPSLVDTPYAVEAVDWLDGELDFIVRQPEGGQAWKLRSLIVPGTLSVRVASEAVPEPASLLLVAAALLGLAVARHGVRVGRSGRHEEVGRFSDPGTSRGEPGIGASAACSGGWPHASLPGLLEPVDPLLLAWLPLPPTTSWRPPCRRCTSRRTCRGRNRVRRRRRCGGIGADQQVDRPIHD